MFLKEGMLSSIGQGGGRQKAQQRLVFPPFFSKNWCPWQFPQQRGAGGAGWVHGKDIYLHCQGTQSFLASHDKQGEGWQEVKIQTFSSPVERGQRVIFWPNPAKGQLDHRLSMENKPKIPNPNPHSLLPSNKTIWEPDKGQGTA